MITKMTLLNNWSFPKQQDWTDSGMDKEMRKQSMETSITLLQTLQTNLNAYK